MDAHVESRKRQKTWIVVGRDGRHVLLGRNSDPSEAEIVQAEQALVVQGLAGYLAVAEGDYYDPSLPYALLEVRPLATPAFTFEEAASALRLRRDEFHREPSK